MITKYEFDMSKATVRHSILVTAAAEKAHAEGDLANSMILFFEVAKELCTNADLLEEPADSLAVIISDFTEAWTKAYPPERFR